MFSFWGGLFVEEEGRKKWSIERGKGKKELRSKRGRSDADEQGTAQKNHGERREDELGKEQKE